MSGWISVHRKILHNPILNRSRKFSNFEAWMYLLLTANHRDNKVLIKYEQRMVKGPPSSDND